ncbi:MAG: hypothetical protein IPL78_29810 [Chloroflexi bacterium]|nr:hypothetical protein [Chloroflexota bacterium]
MAQKTTLTLTGIYGPVLSFTAKTAAPATVYPWRQAGNLPLALLVSASPGGQLLYDWSLDARGVVMSDGERGHESLTWAVEMDVEQAYRVHDALKTPFVVMSCGFVAWEGRLEDKRVTPTGLELTAMGSWRAMSDYGPYNALWSDSSTARWEEGSTEQLSTYAAERFKTDSNNRLFLAPAAGEIFPAGLNIGARYYKIPHRSGRNLTVVQFAYEIKLGLYWTARLRSFDSAWGSAATVWSLAGALGGPVQSGAVYAAVSSGAILSFELVCSYPTTTTLGTAIAEVNTTLAPSALRVDTTSGTAVAAPGTVTITPAAMTNIVNGMKLLYGAGTVNLEKVEVSNVTGTTFDATFKNTHLVSTAIKSTDDWAVPEVDTATTGGHAAGAVTVTPDSMANIVDGISLLIGYGGEAEETVTVSSVTATTFDCTLVYGHPSGDKIRNAPTATRCGRKA